MNKEKMKLRIWHIPQIPGKPFHIEVKSVEEAIVILSALAHYDLFQLEQNIKPDYANAQGLELFNPETKDWQEWEDDDEYRSIIEFMADQNL